MFNAAKQTCVPSWTICSAPSWTTIIGTVLRRMLEARKFTSIERWSVAARFDHEADLAEYYADLEWLHRLFEAGERGNLDDTPTLYGGGCQAIAAALSTIQWFQQEVAAGRLSESQAMTTVIGQGHHRVLAVKS